MKTSLKIFSFIVIPVISIILGLIKYFTSQGSTDNVTIIILLLTLIIIPLVTVVINLLITRYNLDSTHDSLKKTNDEIRKKNSDFLQSTNILISDTIARSNNYYNLHLHSHKDVLAQFIPGLVDEFNMKIKALSNGHLFENDPSKYQEFCSSVFNLAKENGKIRATSIVNPDVFWEDENTINYLRNNKTLIERGVTIERYFFVNEQNKESSLKAIANNLSVNVHVHIIKEEDIKKKDYIKDCGIVDDSIAIESKVDSSRNIFKVDVYIGEKTKYSEINTLFDLLNSKKQTVEEYYSKSEADVINKYAEISFE